MNNCKNCNADPTICEYCIYKNGAVDKEDTNNEKIINYNNMKYDNTSKKICSSCKKVYTGYPATSRKDNKTLICSECAMKEVQEPFEELLQEYGYQIIEND